MNHALEQVLEALNYGLEISDHVLEQVSDVFSHVSNHVLEPTWVSDHVSVQVSNVSNHAPELAGPGLKPDAFIHA